MGACSSRLCTLRPHGTFSSHADGGITSAAGTRLFRTGTHFVYRLTNDSEFESFGIVFIDVTPVNNARVVNGTMN